LGNRKAALVEIRRSKIATLKETNPVILIGKRAGGYSGRLEILGLLVAPSTPFGTPLRLKRFFALVPKRRWSVMWHGKAA